MSDQGECSSLYIVCIGRRVCIEGRVCIERRGGGGGWGVEILRVFMLGYTEF